MKRRAEPNKEKKAQRSLHWAIAECNAVQANDIVLLLSSEFLDSFFHRCARFVVVAWVKSTFDGVVYFIFFESNNTSIRSILDIYSTGMVNK